MRMQHPLLRILSVLAAAMLMASVSVVGAPQPAEAHSFGSRTLARGDSGDDVLELQIRVAGWYSNCAGVPCHEHFPLDGAFGPKTERSVKNFQKSRP